MEELVYSLPIGIFFTRMFSSNAAKQLSSAALQAGKTAAKNIGMKAIDVGKSVAIYSGKKFVEKAAKRLTAPIPQVVKCYGSTRRNY